MKSIALFILIVLGCRFDGVSQSPLPFLRKQGTTSQLIVDGKPFLVLGGELHNSSSSDLDYVRPILAEFARDHLNTVLTPVCWNMIEPREGKFDFSLVDGLIKAARSNDLRLIFLWFGSWKNGVSTYAPVWVKTDLKRFPRAQSKEGKSLDVLSTFSKANLEADAHAFAALMHHIGEVDSAAHTVLMIQVENEVGVLSESRDRSEAADKAFSQQVPKALMDSLEKHKATLVPWLLDRWKANGFKTSGDWEDIFGSGEETDEIFMAWNYARYVGQVAAAGKAQYPLPMYVNTWLANWQKTAPLKPGSYPSGGPMPRMLDIWRAGAPRIDILAPDIYSYFDERLPEYHTSWNPLFIPEMGRDERYASDIFYAIGQFDAIGVSPFGIESVPKFAAQLSKSYKFLAGIAPVILKNQGKGTMGAVVLDKDHPKKDVRVGDYTLHVRITHHYSFTTPDYPAGIFIQLDSNEYLIAGRGLTVSFTPNTPGDPIVGLAKVEEGTFVDGRWVAGRWLNGDETLSGGGVQLGGDYTAQRVQLYRYH